MPSEPLTHRLLEQNRTDPRPRDYDMSPDAWKKGRMFPGGPLGGSRQPKLIVFGACLLSALGVFILTRILSDTGLSDVQLGYLRTNQTRLRGQAATQDLLIKLTQALEQQRQHKLQTDARYGGQIELLQKWLEDVKFALSRVEEQVQDSTVMKSNLEDLRRRVDETLRNSAEEQRGMLEEQSAVLRNIHTAVLQKDATIEYKRDARSRRKKFEIMTVTDDTSEDRWEQRKFRRHGSYGFIRYSSYRTSPSGFAILGLAARSGQVSRRLEGCEFEMNNGSVVEGRLSAHYDTEHHQYLYQFVLLNCHFPEPVTESGGFLTAKIDAEIIPLFREGPNQPLGNSEIPSFLYDIAICGPPMFGDLNPQAVYEFLDYHYSYMGADHFVFYDAGGVTPPVLSAIGRFLKNGVVTVADFREATMWDVWSWAQSLAMHDCTYRLRHLAKWVIMQDLDEYFEVIPPNTIKGILRAHSNQSWITTGCVVFSIRHCVPENYTVSINENSAGQGTRLGSSSQGSGGNGGSVLLSRMQFRWPHVYCQGEKVADRAMCTGQLGHRKLILNPRRVRVLEIHNVIAPMDGMHLSTSVARQTHFQGLAKGNQSLCDQGVPANWWSHYDRISRIAHATHACERDPKTQLCFREGVDGGPSDLLGVERWKLKQKNAETSGDRVADAVMQGRDISVP